MIFDKARTVKERPTPLVLLVLSPNARASK